MTAPMQSILVLIQDRRRISFILLLNSHPMFSLSHPFLIHLGFTAPLTLFMLGQENKGREGRSGADRCILVPSVHPTPEALDASTLFGSACWAPPGQAEWREEKRWSIKQEISSHGLEQGVWDGKRDPGDAIRRNSSTSVLVILRHIHRLWDACGCPGTVFMAAIDSTRRVSAFSRYHLARALPLMRTPYRHLHHQD